MRFSCKEWVKKIWVSVLFWTRFHTVPLTTQKKLNVTWYPVMTVMVPLFQTILLSRASLYWRLSLTVSSPLIIDAVYTHITTTSVFSESMEFFDLSPWSWNTRAPKLYQLISKYNKIFQQSFLVGQTKYPVLAAISFMKSKSFTYLLAS